MRKREEKSKRRTNKYPTEGATSFAIRGYVQKVKPDETHECDYVTFCIVDENDPTKDKDSAYEIIGVTIPWDLEEVEEGDQLKVEGIIKSWTKEYGIKLELRATYIEDLMEVPF